MARRLTPEEFEKRAREVHGDRYSYDLSTFFSTKKKVRITCPEHGEFWQSAGSHIHGGTGCPRCRGGNFYERAREVHGDRYQYGEYTNSTTKIEIICSEHGPFYQLPHSHLNGSGCAQCNGNARLTTEEFIRLASETHGDRFDYSRVNYKNSTTGVIIICPEHGEFLQAPGEHTRGAGCPTCTGRIKTTEMVVEEFREVHGELYDYRLVDYRTAHEDVIIICREHGEFSQLPGNHRSGSGCPRCASFVTNLEECVERAREIHGERYGYENSDYSRMSKKTTITCREHGDFQQSWTGHLTLGHGCPACGVPKPGEGRWSLGRFTEAARKVHGDRYSYIRYTGMPELMVAVCSEHGEFSQLAHNHLRGSGCPSCSIRVSKTHRLILEWLDSIGVSYLVNDRTILGNGQELDIYIPEHTLAIEVDGLYWHTIQFKKDRHYHQKKQDMAMEQGITLLQFWDIEIANSPGLVKSMISNHLGLTPNKVYARRCTLRELTSSEYRTFMKDNHIQGEISSSTRLGLIHNGILVSALGVSDRQGGRKTIDRFANLTDTLVIGGFSRLLSRLTGDIYTHSANRYSQGRLYESQGFDLVGSHPYTLYYTDGVNLHSRNRFQKHRLTDMPGYSPDKTADEILAENKIFPIYPAGTKTWKTSR